MLFHEHEYKVGAVARQQVKEPWKTGEFQVHEKPAERICTQQVLENSQLEELAAPVLEMVLAISVWSTWFQAWTPKFFQLIMASTTLRSA